MASVYAAITEDSEDPGEDSVVEKIRKIQLKNVLLVGVVFMLLSSASQTSSTVETVVIDSVHDQYFNGTSTLGYDLMAVLNGVIAGSVWISQTVVSNIGPKWGMLIGGVCYVLFVSTFVRPLVVTLFTGVVILGIGQAILWTSQGVFLSLNSDKDTIGRNSALFWALYQTSLLWGNLYFFYKIKGAETIDENARYWIFGSLIVLATLGTFLILLLKYPVPKAAHTVTASGNTEVEVAGVQARGIIASMKTSLKLLGTKRMMLAVWMFMYIGLEQTFWSNVYDSSLGYTKQFGTHIAESLVGLSGVFVGIGEIFGSIVFGLLDTRYPRMGRDPIVVSGFFVHMIALFLVFVNIPNNAPLGPSFDNAFIHPSFPLALLCSVLFGFGDSAFNTQLYSYLGEVYAADSVPAFALFQFTWGLTCCGAFFYATVLHLYIQLLMLALVGSVATITFCKLEWDYKKTRIPFLREARETRTISDADLNQSLLSNQESFS